tara:strand:- start:20992 stop:21381 length:390 start_codon:yes stop_codon:yes gene_type:complete
MVVVDSSVWIDFFKDQDNSKTQILRKALLTNDIVMGDIILMEVLQGFKKDSEYKIARLYLTQLYSVSLLDKFIALKAAENYRFLRKKGVTIRSTLDMIIATYCIESKLPLLQKDRDFELIASELDLILL